MQNPVDFLLKFLDKYEEGKLFLPHGSHAHKIHTKHRPVSIWFSEAVAGNMQVCQGGINMYGFTLDDDGFIFYAEVKSDSIELDWQAVLE